MSAGSLASGHTGMARWCPSSMAIGPRRTCFHSCGSSPSQRQSRSRGGARQGPWRLRARRCVLPPPPHGLPVHPPRPLRWCAPSPPHGLPVRQGRSPRPLRRCAPSPPHGLPVRQGRSPRPLRRCVPVRQGRPPRPLRRCVPPPPHGLPVRQGRPPRPLSRCVPVRQGRRPAGGRLVPSSSPPSLRPPPVVPGGAAGRVRPSGLKRFAQAGIEPQCLYLEIRCAGWRPS